MYVCMRINRKILADTVVSSFAAMPVGEGLHALYGPLASSIQSRLQVHEARFAHVSVK